MDFKLTFAAGKTDQQQYAHEHLKPVRKCDGKCLFGLESRNISAQV